MNRACPKFQERLIELADGGSDPELTGHLETCANCRAEFEKWTQLLGAARLTMEEPSAESIRRAEAIMPERPRLVARLVSHSGLAFGMRGSHEEAHVVVDVQGESMRIAYIPSGPNWTVIGRAPSDYDVIRGEKMLALDEDGRFEFTGSAMQETGFAVSRGDQWIDIPDLGHLTEHGPG